MFRRIGFVIGLAAVALFAVASQKGAWAETNPHCSKQGGGRPASGQQRVAHRSQHYWSLQSEPAFQHPARQ